MNGHDLEQLRSSYREKVRRVTAIRDRMAELSEATDLKSLDELDGLRQRFPVAKAAEDEAGKAFEKAEKAFYG